jgi:hypothetical protein
MDDRFFFFTFYCSCHVVSLVFLKLWKLLCLPFIFVAERMKRLCEMTHLELFEAWQPFAKKRITQFSQNRLLRMQC